MVQINVQMDIDRALSKLASIPRDVESKAVPRALNKVAAQAKVQASRQIRDAGYNLKAAVIKNAIAIRRANSGAMVAVVKATGKPIAIVNYGARQVNGGVSVAVKNGRKIIRGAFIATMPSGHTGVFTREGTGHKKVIKGEKVQWHGLPIKEIFGPSIPSAFMNEKVQDALLAKVREKFPGILAHEIAFMGI